jgi:hypothetical protein
MALFAVVAISAVLPPGRAGGGQPAEREVKAHAFGDICLYIVTKPKDSKSDNGFALIEKPTVIRLGERSFIVGTIPAIDDHEVAKAAAGKRLWVPESDVVQMTEFKTVAEAKKYFESAGKQAEKADR